MSSAAASTALRARPLPAAVVDVLVALAVVGGSFALLAPGPAFSSGGEAIDAGSALLVSAVALPILAWRRWPLATFAISTVASCVLAASDHSLVLPLGPTVILYLIASSRDAAHPWTRRTTIVVLGGFVVFVASIGLGKQQLPFLDVVHNVLAWSVAWFAGERTRLNRERMAELHERAVRAEQDAERDRRLAVAEERARLARDLHDSAGHAINVIVVRAGAARLRHEDPARTLAALETIESVARETAREIDQIVGALREPDGEIDAPHGLASLRTLVAEHATAGLEVEVETSGTPRPLPANVDQAAFRILQEALTNASRHGRGTAQVGVAFRDRDVALTVANPVRDEPRSDGGHGLIGMRERAALVGGELHAELLDDTFLLTAHLAYEVAS